MGGLCSSSNFDLSVFVCGGRAVQKEKKTQLCLEPQSLKTELYVLTKGKASHSIKSSLMRSQKGDAVVLEELSLQGSDITVMRELNIHQGSKDLMNRSVSTSNE